MPQRPNGLKFYPMQELRAGKELIHATTEMFLFWIGLAIKHTSIINANLMKITPNTISNTSKTNELEPPN